ncbi:MAG: hypothetical protein M1831_003244 [Alyxoria varia]|nr:MAG: hypothetical protein M1831_003244 [Alyxoria varia]
MPRTIASERDSRLSTLVIPRVPSPPQSPSQARPSKDAAVSPANGEEPEAVEDTTHHVEFNSSLTSLEELMANYGVDTRQRSYSFNTDSITAVESTSPRSFSDTEKKRLIQRARVRKSTVRIVPKWSRLESTVVYPRDDRILAKLGKVDRLKVRAPQKNFSSYKDSMIPMAGGPYNWAACLAPKRDVGRFLSYLTGWLAIFSWQSAAAGIFYVTATVVRGVVMMNYPDSSFDHKISVLVVWAAVVVSIFVNTFLGMGLAEIMSFMFLCVHLLGWAGVSIPLWYMAPGDFKLFHVVFGLGGYNAPITLFVGATTCMFTLFGKCIDAAPHMAEEVHNAPKAIPRAMIWSVIYNGIMGMVAIITIVAHTTDIKQVLAEPSGYPILSILTNGLQDKRTATGLIIIPIIANIFSGTSTLATSSRTLWAFARDRALPFHVALTRVDPRTKLPITAIAVTTAMQLLFSLLILVSDAAFDAFTGSAIAGYYLSFSIPAALMLYYRLTLRRDQIAYGPFRMDRIGGSIVYALALVYSGVGFVFGFFPQKKNPEARDMNWSVLVFGAVMVLLGVNWWFKARFEYQGPVSELEKEPEHQD